MDWSAAETAKVLKTSAPAVNSALQRARAAVKARLSADGTVVIEALAMLLDQDAVMTMPPTPSWYRGRAAILEFHAQGVFTGPLAGRLHLVPIEANYLPAFAVYRDDETAAQRQAFALKVLSVRNEQVVWIAGFADPSLFRLFELPPTLSFTAATLSAPHGL